MREDSRGLLFRKAVAAESPLQVVGTITAYTARMAQATGYRAIYLSGEALLRIHSGCQTLASAPSMM